MALLVDDDTIRTWHNLFAAHGLDGLASFGAGGSACQFSAEQQQALKIWISASLPRSPRQIEAWIMAQYGLGLIALLHRLGLEYHKPRVNGRRLDEKKQEAFIAFYEDLRNSLPTFFWTMRAIIMPGWCRPCRYKLGWPSPDGG